MYQSEALSGERTLTAEGSRPSFTVLEVDSLIGSVGFWLLKVWKSAQNNPTTFLYFTIFSSDYTSDICARSRDYLLLRRFCPVLIIQPKTDSKANNRGTLPGRKRSDTASVWIQISDCVCCCHFVCGRFGTLSSQFTNNCRISAFSPSSLQWSNFSKESVKLHKSVPWFIVILQSRNSCWLLRAVSAGPDGDANPDGAALSPHLMPQLAPMPSVRTRLGRDLSERNIIIPPNKIISIEERFP